MLNPALKLNKEIFYKDVDRVPLRDGYGEGLVEAGKKSDSVIVLCADLTESTRSQAFKEKFPNRFIEVGVAEQNMAGIAAGMALSGKTAFISSYAVFSPGRNWDQVRVSICYSKANVKIAGSHAGLSVGPDGATHQALEDIAITKVLPNLTVLTPIDYYEAKKATVAASEAEGPVYIRLARAKTPVITTENSPFEIGKANVLKEGRQITIATCGPVSYHALIAAKEIEEELGISCEVINVSSVKPLDAATLSDSVKKTKRLLTVEEHQVSGGMGSAVAEAISQEYPVMTKIMGIKDTFGESGKYEELLEKYELSSEHIKMEIRNLFHKNI